MHLYSLYFNFICSMYLNFPLLLSLFVPFIHHPETPTPDPRIPPTNVTLSPLQKEELARLRKKQLANAVHYIWETGEDKYMLRYFHTGFWLSCEKHNEGMYSNECEYRTKFSITTNSPLPKVFQHPTYLLSA